MLGKLKEISLVDFHLKNFRLITFLRLNSSKIVWNWIFEYAKHRTIKASWRNPAFRNQIKKTKIKYN